MTRVASGSARFPRASAEATAHTRALRTLVLWGDRNSGKSGVVGALHSEGTRTVGDRWTLESDDAMPETAEYAASASLALRLRDVKETPVRRPDRPATFTARRFEGRHESESLELTVLDPAGLVTRSPESVAAHDVLRAIASADGVVWLVEARGAHETQTAAEHASLLRELVAILEASGEAQLAVPVAVVLAKIDRLPADEMRRALNTPETALRAQLGDTAFGWLLAACPRLRCFAVSAAGTVRNAARPVGLTPLLDWFVAEWRRGARQERVMRARARRSARVERVRRRAPLAGAIAASIAIVAFAGVAAARRLSQSSRVWSASAGGVADQAASSKGASLQASPRTPAGAPATLAAAAEAYERGHVRDALLALTALRVDTGTHERETADSLLALAALQASADSLGGGTLGSDVPKLVVASTSEAIARARPGSYVLAPLSLGRAAACIGGRLTCADEQLREDLAWVLLLGTPTEQDEARRLRALWIGQPDGRAVR